jgi:hypothetical protein
MNYYNPEKILNMKDLNNEKPDIFIITTNRSAGKTTSFLKKALEDFKNHGSQLVLLYRYNYELNACADIFKDVMNIYPDYGEEMKTLPHARGLYYELFLDDETFGYAVSLNNPDALKKYSPIFADVENIIFDEFQCETGKYLSKEVEKFQSIYLTIARGGGQQSRHVKVYMLGNMVTIMNPYFINLGIHKRLKDNTNFMRGNGWVAEFGFNEAASQAIKKNGVFKAFSKEDYMSYSTEKVYLHDADIFIEKPKGRAKYICTILHDSTQYGVREYFDDGVIYVSHKPDNSCKQVIAFKASDHNQNTIMLNHYSYLWKNIRDAFNNGYLRFDDMKAKSAIFDILSVDLYK